MAVQAARMTAEKAAIAKAHVNAKEHGLVPIHSTLPDGNLRRDLPRSHSSHAAER